MRAHIGEFGFDFSETSAKIIEEFGDALQPYLQPGWVKARELINSELPPIN